MTDTTRALRTAVALLALVAFVSLAQAAEPLASWREGEAKQQIIQFVDEVTQEGGTDYVPPEERIAVFDNDGTLWCEQPLYVQTAFILDRVKAIAPNHPEWSERPLFQAAVDGDLAAVLSHGEHGLLELLLATHAGMTTEEFKLIVEDWIASAKHPRFDRPYTECVYQPMLELIAYLGAHEFKTFIVSGGGVEFMRPWTEEVYGIPPEQVVGSTIAVKYVLRDGTPALLRLPEVTFNDDKDGKVIAIHQQIGRRPLIAFGNSDGDLQMLQWTAAGEGPRLCLLVHHTDGEREWAYDRTSPTGRLDRALDEAMAKDWTVVDMKRDWLRVFPFEK